MSMIIKIPLFSLDNYIISQMMINKFVDWNEKYKKCNMTLVKFLSAYYDIDLKKGQMIFSSPHHAMRKINELQLEANDYEDMAKT